MNQVVLMGRLTRDPELRHTQGGTAVSSFTLAVDRGYTSKDSGERQTDFIDIVAWRNTAEFVSKYFVKGQMAAVIGRLQIRDWTDKEGNKRRSAEVIAENVYFTESKKSREGDTGYNFSQQKSDLPGGYQTPVQGSDFAELEDDDGDLPF
ncbi:MAG: single-stranded DNA-binding protein [Clostridiales bacterium]|nr:single-stranded DNA-binding protein [Clostridiales bacterium]